MKKAILYIRVSTDEQADKGYSQRSQAEILERYCQINNIVVVDSYFEDHSAKTFARPQFSKLLMQLRKTKQMVDLLLFTKWDRFSRNAPDAYQMINTLNKLSVDPQAIEQPLDLDIPENKMMLAFYLAAPEVENDRRALNVISGMRRAQKEGRFVNKAPYGYKNHTGADGRKFIEPDANAKKVVWIFQQLATGNYSSESILKAAKDRGVTIKKNAFWNMLRNPVYTGKIKIKAFKQYEEQIVIGQHKPIISDDLFYLVQSILDGRHKSQVTSILASEKFPLRGMLLCHADGKTLTASSSKGRKHYYDYYHCTSQCGTRYKAELAHEAMIKELAKWKPNPAIASLFSLVIKDLVTQDRSNATSAIKQIKSEIIRLSDRLKKARDLMLQDAIDTDDFRIIKTECERGTIKAEKELAELSNTADIDQLITKCTAALSHFDQLYINGTASFKKQIVGSIFPDKLVFTGVVYRTTRVNEAVQLCFNIGKAFSQMKKGQLTEKTALSHLVNPPVHFSNLLLYDMRMLAALVA